ncbi:hypothetical protein [Streptomyces stackebrandtii]|nr:hypothetical protein [Streptomyces sp. DSM 40976]
MPSAGDRPGRREKARLVRGGVGQSSLPGKILHKGDKHRMNGI